MKLTNRNDLVVGVSGIMGSGKSTVTKVFERLGAKRIDADSIGKSMLDIPEVRKELLEAFGNSIVGTTGKIEASLLAKVAFKDRQAASMLNSITHPHLVRRLLEEVGRARETSPIIVIDAALLPEWRLQSVLDILIVVDAPIEEAIRRACKHRGFGKQQVIARMQNQLSRRGKIRRADLIIPNYGTLEELSWRATKIFWYLAETWGGD